MAKPIEFIYVPGQAVQIAKYATTRAQYREFCEATNRKLPPWPEDWDDQCPATNVTAFDAEAYCVWYGEKIGKTVRLPTEAELLAVMPESCPKTDSWEPGKKGPLPVGSVPESVSKYGHYDLLGGVWEWTAADTGEGPG